MRVDITNNEGEVYVSLWRDDKGIWHEMDQGEPVATLGEDRHVFGQDVTNDMPALIQQAVEWEAGE